MGAIVQAITGADGRTFTRQQLTVLVRNGLRIQGYLWCFPGSTIASVQSRLAMFDGFTLEGLWLDVEQDGLVQSDVDRDLVLCDAYTHRPKSTGIYSGHWFFVKQGWLTLTRWADRRLWESNYDDVADVAVHFTPYGGWTRPAIKQYMGTSSIGSVHQIDLDVMA